MARKCKCRATGEDGFNDTFIKIDGHYYKSQEVYDEYQSKLQEIKSGVYKITNIRNNKVYIGESMDIKRRWKEHIDALKEGGHANYLLQNDFNENSSDSFKFDILQEYKADNLISTKCHLLMLEYKYIKKYEKENYKLYNLEYSLLEALAGNKLVFQLEGFDPLRTSGILVSQVRKFKFQTYGDIFKLIERNTPLSVFIKLSGYSSYSKSGQKYKNFIEILNKNYKNEMDKIIKTYRFKYKLKVNHDEIIEEVTDFGIQIFEYIFKENQYLRKYRYTVNNSKTKSTSNKKQTSNDSETINTYEYVAISNFIAEIRDKLAYDVDTYCSIKNWFVDLGVVNTNKNHIFISDFSTLNDFLIPKSKCYDKKNEIEYFTILTTNIFRDYINNLLNNMPSEDKIEIFYNPSVERINNTYNSTKY